MCYIGGFPPWAFKYTDWQHVGGKHGGVATEWQYTRLVSAYNGFKDADAIACEIVTNGGRVINVVVKEKTLEKAISKVYDECEKIKFKDRFFRKKSWCPVA